MRPAASRRLAALAAAVLATSTACRPKPGEIRISPAKATLFGMDRKAALTADVFDRKGNPMPNVTVQWDSSNPKIASVDKGGVVKSLSAGRVQVHATLPGLTGSATVEVVDVVSIVVTPSRATIVGPRGSPCELGAEIKDSKGAVVALKPRWTVADPKVALVSSGGVVTSVGEGLTTVTASLGDIASVCDLRVLFREIGAFEISPQTLILRLGETQRISVVVRDAAGVAIEDAALAWTTSDPKVAVVSGGLVAATGRGTATVAVSAASRTLQATILVN